MRPGSWKCQFCATFVQHSKVLTYQQVGVTAVDISQAFSGGARNSLEHPFEVVDQAVVAKMFPDLLGFINRNITHPPSDLARSSW